MGVSQLPDVLMGAFVLAALYVLVGLSWIVVFRASQFLNFATGQTLIIGPFLLTTFQAHGFGYASSALLTMGIMAVFGFLFYRLLLKPFTGYPILTTVIVTMGVAIILDNSIQIVFGVGSRTIELPFEDVAYSLPGGIRLTRLEALLLGTSALFYAGLLVFLGRAKLGMQMRAANEDVVLASQTGLDVSWIFGVAFSISFAALTLAGIGSAQRTLVSASAIPLGLQGLVPAMVGGLDSVGGVLAGALIVAVIGSFTTFYLGLQYNDLVVYAILLVVLALKPNGLFGTQEVRRV